MSLTGSEMSPADYAAISGNNNGVFGNNDGIFWLFILFMFFGANGWGNGSYGNAGGVGGEIQRGFDQQAIMGGFNNLGAQMSAMQMQQQNCCCDTRQAVSNLQYAVGNEGAATRQAIGDVRYSVASEACADRQAVSEGVRDIIANQTAGIQTILDKLCQQEIDALKTQNANLQTQINLANLQASQTAQTARILQDNAAQTVALEQYLNPAPVPAYVVQNPNCCSQNFGCGCGTF